MFSAIGWVWIEDAEYCDEFGEPTAEPRQATLDAVTALMERLVPPSPFSDNRRSLPRAPRVEGPSALDPEPAPAPVRVGGDVPSG